MVEEENVYKSVPEHVISENYVSNPTDREKILATLMNNKGQRMTAKEISKKCGLPLNGSCVRTRKAITELIEVDEYPICSGKDGFFYPIDKSEIRDYIESLEIRRAGLDRRIDALTRIILKEY